jgi:ketosteroid isomerase-like protein
MEKDGRLVLVVGDAIFSHQVVGGLRRMTNAQRMILAVAVVLVTTPCGVKLSSASASPTTVIRAALERWRDDFNAGRPDHICDLFAHDLRYDFQGLPEQNYAFLCNRLHRALANHTQSYHYGLDIKEIIVSGDLAVVRLTWTSTLTEKDGRHVTEDEPGLDVFGRDTVGEWKIIRYMSYPENP